MCVRVCVISDSDYYYEFEYEMPGYRRLGYAGLQKARQKKWLGYAVLQKEL